MQKQPKRVRSLRNDLTAAYHGSGKRCALIAVAGMIAAFLAGFLLRTVNVWAALVVGVLVLLCTAAACLLWYQKHVSEPVYQMTESARKIAGGSYGTELAPVDEAGLEPLREAINIVSQEISRTEKMQSEFISSISHELRTPLTAITGWGETLMFDMNIKGDSREGLKTILRESSRLTGLVEELLEFTRIQDGRFKLNIELLDIEAEQEDTIFTYRELLLKDKIDLS